MLLGPISKALFIEQFDIFHLFTFSLLSGGVILTRAAVLIGELNPALFGLLIRPLIIHFLSFQTNAGSNPQGSETIDCAQ